MLSCESARTAAANERVVQCACALLAQVLQCKSHAFLLSVCMQVVAVRAQSGELTRVIDRLLSDGGDGSDAQRVVDVAEAAVSFMYVRACVHSSMLCVETSTASSQLSRVHRSRDCVRRRALARRSDALAQRAAAACGDGARTNRRAARAPLRR
jgi:hypothetical protein